MKALIIDDDPVTRLYFQEILAPHGETVEASSGEEGLTQFSLAMSGGLPFDTVLVDVRMPGMDGHQTLEKIRSLERDSGVKKDQVATVLMISAMDDPRNVSRAFFQSGAMGYLTKPVDPDALLAELRKFGLLE